MCLRVDVTTRIKKNITCLEKIKLIGIHAQNLLIILGLAVHVNWGTSMYDHLNV